MLSREQRHCVAVLGCLAGLLLLAVVFVAPPRPRAPAAPPPRGPEDNIELLSTFDDAATARSALP
jgi:hypothetical protein